MTNAYRDENSVPTLIGVSSTDGQTPTRVYVDPTTHRVLVDASSAVTPGNPTNSIQFNDGGLFGGDTGLLFDKTTDTITIGESGVTGVLKSYQNLSIDTSLGGNLTVVASAAVALSGSDGGGIELDTGLGDGVGQGGPINVFAGNGGTSGRGGLVNFQAGNGGTSSGNGGLVQFTAGNARSSTGDGGNIIFTAGWNNGGSGQQGKLKFFSGGASNAAILDTASIASTDKTFTFPNQSGIFALVGGTLTTPQSPTSGTVDGVNAAFVFTTKPNVIVSDGATYRENFGWTWNAGTTTATMSASPSFDLFGL